MSSEGRDRPRIAWKPFSPHASTWRERFWDPSDTASARVRCLAPCAALADAGWRSELFDRDRAHDYDLVVFQKAYDEPSLELASELKRRGTRLVLDLCDNHFYNPGDKPDLSARARRLERMLELVDAVSVSTPALAEATPDVGRPMSVVDDALDPLLERVVNGDGDPVPRGDGPFRIVWFGMQIPDLGVLEDELRGLHAELPLELTIVGNSRRAARAFGKRADVPVRFRRWTPDGFADAMRGHHACVIPVPLNPFTVVKTTNRVVTSLLLGVPVVASRIPSYEDEFSECVLFEDWAANLARYARDPGLAAAHVEAGREHIRSRYTREHLVGQWSNALEAAIR